VADILPRGPVSDFGSGADNGVGWFSLADASYRRIARLCLGLLLSVVVVANGWMGVQEWRGHVSFGQAYLRLNAAPIDAFEFTVKAVQTYQWDWEIRQQVYLSLRNLTLHHEVVMNEDSERWAWEVSYSASPWSPLLHASKIEVPDG